MNAQMNSTFRGAAAQFISKQHPITHKQVGHRMFDCGPDARALFFVPTTHVHKMFCSCTQLRVLEPNAQSVPRALPQVLESPPGPSACVFQPPYDNGTTLSIFR